MKLPDRETAVEWHTTVVIISIFAVILACAIALVLLCCDKIS